MNNERKFKKNDHKQNVLEKWAKRREDKETVFNIEFKQKENESNVHIYPTNEKDNLGFFSRSHFSEMTGAVGFNYAKYLLEGLFMASPNITKTKIDAHKNKVAQAYQEALVSMSPNDEFEGMLITRLIVLHDQIMDFTNRMNNPKMSERLVDKYINRIAKLTRLHNETLAALNKHKRKGEQRVVVQHQNINVEKGGQAAVGSFQAGGEG